MTARPGSSDTETLQVVAVSGERPVRAVIGVAPAAEHARRPRLMRALEDAFAVRLEPRDGADWSGLDGLLAIGAEGAAALATAPAGLACLHAARDEREARHSGGARLTDHLELARPLRGAQLPDRYAIGLDGEPPPADDVLAIVGRAPAWTVSRASRAIHHRVAIAPAELGADEALRDRVMPDRCLALIAIVQFLRELAGERCADPPPLRATFLLDDPNLHWPTYGHVSYQQILTHARQHGYHLAVATVPLDGWFAHPRAVRLFREGAAQLSLTVHGNDHYGPELAKVHSAEHATTLAAQALRRVAAFERRTGIAVDRVMVPPHEAASETAAAALVSAGFEAICMSRPYPWLAGGSWLTCPPQTGPLRGWRCADVVLDELPVLLRTSLTAPREELALRAFLGQPLVVYGHDDALAGGPGVLEQTAAAINGMGDVRWGPLSSIVRASAELRRTRDAIDVRMLSRTVRVDVPATVGELRVDAAAFGSVDRLCVRAVARPPTAGGDAVAGEPVRLQRRGATQVELAVQRSPGTPPPALALPRVRPIARRLASEGRDRARAVVERASGRSRPA